MCNLYALLFVSVTQLESIKQKHEAEMASLRQQLEEYRQISEKNHEQLQEQYLQVGYIHHVCCINCARSLALSLSFFMNFAIDDEFCRPGDSTFCKYGFCDESELHVYIIEKRKG